MTHMTKIASAALALAILSPIPVMAETVSVPVRYGDLDLSTPEGRRALDSRIAVASRHICGSAELEQDIARKSRVQKCVAEVRRSAEPVRLAAIATKTRAVS